MAKIKIMCVPPGFAPKHIRLSWVGLTLPLIPGDEVEKAPDDGIIRVGLANVMGYHVWVADAVKVLHAARKHDAAYYWANFGPDCKLVFKQDCCEIVEPIA